MVRDIVYNFNAAGAREFANAINALAEKCEALEKENIKLKKIRKKTTEKIMAVKDHQIIEFENIQQAAKFLNIYTWEAAEMLENGDIYNGFYLDVVKDEK